MLNMQAKGHSPDNLDESYTGSYDRGLSIFCLWSSRIFLYLLAGYIYDQEAQRQSNYSYPASMRATNVDCLGPNCFRVTFIIMERVCAYGVLMSIILAIQIRPIYETLYGRGSLCIPKPTDTEESTLENTSKAWTLVDISRFI